MNLLFIYGEAKVIFDDNNNKYTNGTITKEAWEDRYKVLGKITFMARKNKKIFLQKEAQKRFCIIDNDVRFIELEDYMTSLKNWFSIKIRKEIKNKIEEQVKECDFLIARIPSDYSYIAIDYAKKYNKNYLIEVVGCSWDSLWNHGIRGKVLALPAHIRLKKNVKRAKNSIYVSNNFLQKRYPTKGNFINCSNVILNKVENENLIKRIEKINKKDEKIILGTCGGLDVECKGQKYVIKAISKLRKKEFKNIEYQLVGGGFPEKLVKLAEKNKILDCLNIIGSLEHDMVLEWMKKIDIYIQPSNQEGLCRSIIEAESMACPVIASNAGGNTELINNKYIFKKRNVNQLVKKIKLMNKDEMLIEAKNNFENSKQYQRNILKGRRYEFYDKILNIKT